MDCHVYYAGYLLTGDYIFIYLFIYRLNYLVSSSHYMEPNDEVTSKL
jgi:hypothetical protein